jgi:hypothetical protein
MAGIGARIPPPVSYRALELLCRQQAKLAATAEARNELERVALEYGQLADWQERHGWTATN